MSFDSALLYAFLLVFVRCGAMLFASPMFGAQNTPVPVRIFTTLCLAAALTCTVKPVIGPLPADLYAMAGAVLKEALAGLLIGVFMSLVLLAAQMAGSIADLQLGLGMSQALNPVTGIPVSVLSQFKFMLALVVYLSMNCHHTMLVAFTRSYDAMPALGYESMPAVRDGFIQLLSSVSLLAVQLAAPVLAVGLIVDAGLGLVNRAVPQMQAMLVGLPAKTILGMMVLSMGLPAIASAISSGVGVAIHTLTQATGGP